MKIRVWSNSLAFVNGYADHEAPIVEAIREMDGTLAVAHYDNNLQQEKWTVYAKGAWEAYELASLPTADMEAKWTEKHNKKVVHDQGV